MTTRELAREARRVLRQRSGEVAPRFPPDDATEMLDDAEGELGFPLPKLIRTVFTYAGTDFVDLAFAVDQYGDRFVPDREPDADGYWPDRLLPVKHLADRLWLCVDCGCEGEPVYTFDEDAPVEGPCWPGMFVEVAASFAEFLEGFIAGGGEWPTRPESDDRLWVEYQGARFRLTRAYFDYDAYKNDPENLDPSEAARVERAVAAVRVATTYPSREQLMAAVGEIQFPGYGLSCGTIPQPDGSQLVLIDAEIPRAGKNRVIVYRDQDGRCTLLDDFVTAEDRISRVHEADGRLVYSTAAGNHVLTREARSTRPEPG